MTVIETRRVPAAARGSSAARRLTWLHLVSRQVPVALLLLAGCGLLLGLLLQLNLVRGSDANSQELPLLIEGMAAAVVAITARGPFGEPERTTGTRLIWLRFAAALLTTGAAFVVLSVATLGARLPGGELTLLRNVGGLIGIGLLCAVAIDGARAWIGPLGYAVIAEVAISSSWRAAWLWPGQPTHAHGAAWWAGLAYLAGVVLMTVRGARDVTGE